jgi:hypothetical protein
MKSWAHTYMAGSLLGTVLIVAALVAFVPLVSLNAPDEWPTPGLELGGGAGKGDAGVSSAVAVVGERSNPGGRDLTPDVASTGTADAAGGVTRAQAPELRGGNGRSGGVETVGPPEKAAVAPAPAEVVVRSPGSPPEGAVAPPPSVSQPEAGGAPAPPTAEGELAGLDETPSTGPVVAGVGGEEPELQPPEEAESPLPEGAGATPPPSGAEGGGVPGLPGLDDEGGEAPPEDVDAPVGVGAVLELDPGALGPEVVDRSVADLARATPRLMDVAADR